ncbi:MAG: hypothetical protein UY35_C0010G0006 [Candidatus Saccharibacteria bacterium GW2011_GWC2_48_9]|nr:MAG: hypothetical protein UY35_C0010G0006 [Candidatus Saccharibacteria bacterium GW2011_GWC2_48_9]HCH34010.1 glycosyl hydrolase family 67 [Candidatus Saccharibacteria bacterium]
MQPRYQIIDAIGPFVLDVPKDTTINWSKVPFSQIEQGGRLSAATRAQILSRFDAYLAKVQPQGYGTLSIDDLAHMIVFEWYSPKLQKLLADYNLLYRDIVALAQSYGMAVFVNTDYIFWNDEIQSHLESSGMTAAELLDDACELLTQQVPGVAGVILRIGESDGRDIRDTFVSKLALRTSRAANRLLRHLLPRFEQHSMTLIVRTWTVGVYQIGDLIWNSDTYDEVFGDIDSDALVVSMKYGDTDFMRYLDLNPLFRHGHHCKIIELQTRREWEGMGALPAFVGWQYSEYLEQLRDVKELVGIHVWCQTGGWAKSSWNNVTYLQQSSLWVELNTEVVASMYHDGMSVEAAAERFCVARNLGDSTTFLQMLRSGDSAITRGLYIAAIAQQKLYFRRTRLPTLLWLTWDKVDISPVTLRLLRLLINKDASVLLDAKQAYSLASSAVRDARLLNLDASARRSLEVLQETLRLALSVKTSLVSQRSNIDAKALDAAVERYRRVCPDGYTITQVALPRKYQRFPIGFLARRLLRGNSSYRKRDKLLLKTSRVQRALVRYSMRNSSLKDQSMGIESLFY